MSSLRRSPTFRGRQTDPGRSSGPARATTEPSRARASSRRAAKPVASIEAALLDAGVSPDTVGYVEAHGTGARGSAIRWRSPRLGGVPPPPHRRLLRDRLVVKANVGHLRCAAGVTSLIRPARARTGRRCRSPRTSSARIRWIDFDASPFRASRPRSDRGRDAPTRGRVVVRVRRLQRPRRARGGAGEARGPFRAAVHLLPVSARTEAAHRRRRGAARRPGRPRQTLAGRRRRAHAAGRASAFAHRDPASSRRRSAPRRSDAARALARDRAPGNASPVSCSGPGDRSASARARPLRERERRCSARSSTSALTRRARSSASTCARSWLHRRGEALEGGGGPSQTANAARAVRARVRDGAPPDVVGRRPAAIQKLATCWARSSPRAWPACSPARGTR